MKIGIYTNSGKDENFNLTKKFIELLKAADSEIFISSNMQDSISGKRFTIGKESVDVLVVFGGDGTILGIVSEAAKAGIPILGINLGYLGFLTEVENDRLEDTVKLLTSGNYTIDERAMLETDNIGTKYYALNDIVFLRDANFENAKKLVQFEASADGNLIDRFFSDGLIVSTPTGSTAYSLSAGGPILSPHIEAVLITAICPHSLHSRPIVLSDSENLYVEICGESARVCVSIDGYNKFYLSQGSSVNVVKSKYKAKFIRFKNTNFYNKLINKLNKWSTTSF